MRAPTQEGRPARDAADPREALAVESGPEGGMPIRTAATEALATRALAYLEAGAAVHLRGPAGSGKTRAALDLAARLGRPVLLLVGDASFDTAALVGGEAGSRSRRVVDRYVTSVMKVETETAPVWLDRALTTACAEGCTLVYDEFNRAPAAANNVLLPVLEERLLPLPRGARPEGAVRVHPAFRAIFTSNPEDHAGTQAAQDALLDRMVTIDLDGFDRETEVAIAAARSGLDPALAARIVDLVRDVRRSGACARPPTLRAGIAIARLAAAQGLAVSAAEPRFVQLVLDVLASRMRVVPEARGMLPQPEARGVLPQPEARGTVSQMLARLVAHYCPPEPAARPAVERAA